MSPTSRFVPRALAGAALSAPLLMLGFGVASADPVQPGTTSPAPSQPGTASPAPSQPGTSSPAPAPAPAPKKSVPAAPAKPVYWGPAPQVQPKYVPKPNYDYNTGQKAAPTPPAYVAPLNPTQLAPGTAYEPAPMYIAPEKTIMIGDVHFTQPNWVSDEDADRTNNTSELIRTDVSNVWRGLGVEPERADRVAIAQITGTAVGATAGAAALGVPAAGVGALVGGTIGGNVGMGLGAVVVPGIGAVPGAVAGTAVGAGVGAAALGVPAATIGAVGGGAVGLAAGTAFGAGDEADEPIEIDVPDIDQPAITADTQAVVQDWEANPPAGPAVVNTVRDVQETAPTFSQEVRDSIEAMPGGIESMATIDQAFEDFHTDTATIGLPVGMVGDAIAEGFQDIQG